MPARSRGLPAAPAAAWSLGGATAALVAVSTAAISWLVLAGTATVSPDVRVGTPVSGGGSVDEQGGAVVVPPLTAWEGVPPASSGAVGPPALAFTDTDDIDDARLRRQAAALAAPGSSPTALPQLGPGTGSTGTTAPSPDRTSDPASGPAAGPAPAPDRTSPSSPSPTPPPSSRPPSSRPPSSPSQPAPDRSPEPTDEPGRPDKPERDDRDRDERDPDDDRDDREDRKDDRDDDRDRSAGPTSAAGDDVPAPGHLLGHGHAAHSDDRLGRGHDHG